MDLKFEISSLKSSTDAWPQQIQWRQNRFQRFDRVQSREPLIQRKETTLC